MCSPPVPADHRRPKGDASLRCRRRVSFADPSPRRRVDAALLLRSLRRRRSTRPTITKPSLRRRIRRRPERTRSSSSTSITAISRASPIIRHTNAARDRSRRSAGCRLAPTHPSPEGPISMFPPSSSNALTHASHTASRPLCSSRPPRRAARLTIVSAAEVRVIANLTFDRASGACLAMFASDSWVMRYSASPTAAETLCDGPSVSQSTFRPARRNRRPDWRFRQR